MKDDQNIPYRVAEEIDQSQRRADRGVLIWLMCVALLVFAMIIVGGATRLTDSGLSITEWLPILGVIPPLTESDWLAAFEKYKQIPEYEFVNKGMTLGEFKYIYWWEWAHRFLGRFIGLAFALPLAAFLFMGKLEGRLTWQLFGIFALGGLQGLIGWYMVQSGLVDRVDVSHYRLALHLTTAFVILACLVWLIRDQLTGQQTSFLKTSSRRVRFFSALILAVVFLQVVFGAFVAGLKAGLSNNTWPLMNGEFFPSDLWSLSPWISNLFENPTTIQFLHRNLAYVLLAMATFHVWQVFKTENADTRLRWQAILLVGALVAQAAAGIWILLAAPNDGQIPIGLGLAHQGGAAIVLAIVVWHVHTALRGYQARPAQ